MSTLKRTQRAFVWSCALILLATGGAKLLSATGKSPILDISVPILIINYRTAFWVVGLLEIYIAYYCITKPSNEKPLLLIGWVSLNFLIYRLGFLLIGFSKPCPCLGELADKLGMSDSRAENILFVLVGYLFLGSSLFLFLNYLLSSKDKASPNDLFFKRKSKSHI